MKKVQDGITKKNELTEELTANPGDRSIAAQIKAIDEQNGATVGTADAAVEKFPDSDKIWRAGAAVVIQSGDYKKGLAYADRAVALAEAKPDDADALASALRVRATGALWSGDYPRAAADAARVLISFPDDKGARSIYEMSKGRTKAGAAAAGQAQSRPLANSLVENALLDHPRLREAGRRAGDRAGANKLAAEAMRRINMGDGAGALAAANATVAADPTLADGYMMRGLAHTILREFAQALREFTKAIDLWSAQGKNENLPVAYGRRAEALNESKDYPNALRDAEKAVRGDAGLGLGYFERARALEGLGEKGERILADYKRAADLEPQYKADYASARTRLSPGASEGKEEGGAAVPAARNSVFFNAWTKLLNLAGGGLGFLVGALGATFVLFAGWVFLFAKEGSPASRVRSFFTRLGARTQDGERSLPPMSGAGGAEADGLEGRTVDGGKYRVVCMLGQGGMGMVYKAYDLGLKRDVAIKCMNDFLLPDQKARERFVAEGRTGAKLRHPNIVAVYSFFMEGKRALIVFEHIEGNTLLDMLNESPGRRLDFSLALKILAQLASAVDYAHGEGVIHRDLKPSNVMVFGGDRAKVMDFGISRVVEHTQATNTSMIVGTPVYMAPEQQDGVVVRESDIYTLGIIAFEMLTGMPPFRGEGLQLDKREGRFPAASALAPSLPASVDVVFKKALDPDSKKRYARAEDFRQALEAALSQATPPRA